MTIEKTKEWFEVAVPVPTDRHFWVQAGCDAEECAEGFEALGFGEIVAQLHKHADAMKKAPEMFSMSSVDRVALLDAICDRIVTGIGMAHMLGMDIIGALDEVNRSNFSKFEDGKPVFNEHGKIKKGRNYKSPELARFVGVDAEREREQ